MTDPTHRGSGDAGSGGTGSGGTDFGSATDDYRRGRPDYPADLVAWLIGSAARVADVGAGTGKLTGALRTLGREVIAVDPDARMLDALREDHPGVATRVGTAEALPLADDAVDAVTYGQAWHWVDPSAASVEAARVLTPGGTLGLIWNIRDESVPWVAELTSIITPSAAERLIATDRPLVADPFDEVVHRRTSWSRAMTVADLRAMVASRSYLIAAPEPRRREVLDAATSLATRVAGDDGVLHLPYRTEAFRAVLPG